MSVVGNENDGVFVVFEAINFLLTRKQEEESCFLFGSIDHRCYGASGSPMAVYARCSAAHGVALSETNWIPNPHFLNAEA